MDTFKPNKECNSNELDNQSLCKNKHVQTQEETVTVRNGIYRKLFVGHMRWNRRLKCSNLDHITKTTPSTTPRYKGGYTYTKNGRMSYGATDKNKEICTGGFGGNSYVRHTP